MKTFSYRSGALSGKLDAESPFEAAQVILGTKDVYCCKDWTGQVFTSPFRYVGTIYNDGIPIENVECQIWEKRHVEI